MSSVSQITIGIIILGAAFIFGHYVNKERASQETVAQNAPQVDESELVWDKQPVPMPTVTQPGQSQGSFLDLNKRANSRTDIVPAESTPLAATQPPVNQSLSDSFVAKQPNPDAKKELVEPDFASLFDSSFFSQTELKSPPTVNNLPAKTPELTQDQFAQGRIAPVRQQLTQDQFAGSDFQPNLKQRFDRRVESLRNANLTPGPDDDSGTMDSRWTLNKQPLVQSIEPARLADQIPVRDPALRTGPAIPQRDLVTGHPQQVQPTRERLVPFRLNEQAQSRLVSVSSNKALQVESEKYSTYVAKDGDSLQSISVKFYGKPDYYLDIFVANQDLLRTPARVPAGTRLRVPMYK